MRNQMVFQIRGKVALFSDPVTRIGGEKCTYSVPTYQALKGICESIYWKPTFIWVIDRLRVMNRIRTQSQGIRVQRYFENKNDLSVYTYLSDVCYQVEAHFEWNLFREELSQDRDEKKHDAIAKRMVEKGGRRDVFLGTRECQAYVEPCVFGCGPGHYDSIDLINFGIMVHGISYPDESGKERLVTRLWDVKMRSGVIDFIRPEECSMAVETTEAGIKQFLPDSNFTGAAEFKEGI